MKDALKKISIELPLQHNPGCMQFKCDCGTTLTFAENSQTYPMLIDRTFPGPGMKMGACPACGAKHWRGRTKR